MAASALTTSSSTLRSPPPAYPAGSNTAAMDTVARSHLSPQASSTTARLIGVEPARDPLQEEYQETRGLFNDNKLEDDRALFAEIISNLTPTDTNLLYLADSKIVLAYIYPEDSYERSRSAIEAKETLDLIYKNRSSWDDLDLDQRTVRYKLLRMMLEQLHFLIPDTLESFKADIPSKIKECNRHIPLISDFYDKMSQGIQSFRAKNYDQASEFYTQALGIIEGHSKPDYLLARAYGIMHLAMTYPPGGDHHRLALEAQVLTFEVYDRKNELFKDEKSKLTALNLFCQVFEGLSQIIPDVADIQTQIKEKLEECLKERELLRDLAATGGSSGPEGSGLGTTPPNSKVSKDPVDSLKTATGGSSGTENPGLGTPLPGSKVSKEPVDPWKAAKLFIAFGFAAVVIAGAFVLGRRYITRLN